VFHEKKKKDSASTVWKTTVTEITEKNGKSEMKMSMFLPNTYQN